MQQIIQIIEFKNLYKITEKWNLLVRNVHWEAMSKYQAGEKNVQKWKINVFTKKSSK
jgi:hypothetical protein